MDPLPLAELDKARKVFKLMDRRLRWHQDLVGIAANQLHFDYPIIAYKLPNQSTTTFLVNPQFEPRDSKLKPGKESCLSIPSITASVMRFDKIYVRGYNENGEKVQFEADGLLSRVIQHEIDHLHGILFTDKMIPQSLKHIH